MKSTTSTPKKSRKSPASLVRKPVTVTEQDKRQAFDAVFGDKGPNNVPPVTIRDEERCVPFDIQKFHRMIVEMKDMIVESGMGEDKDDCGIVQYNGITCADAMDFDDSDRLKDALDIVLAETESLLSEAATAHVWQEIESKRRPDIAARRQRVN